MLLTIEEAQAQVLNILHANILPNEADESPEMKRNYEVAEWIGAFLIRSKQRRWTHVRWEYAVRRAEKLVAGSEDVLARAEAKAKDYEAAQQASHRLIVT